MRTWGRVTNPDGTRSWVKVETDAAGRNDYIWVTTLIQTLQGVLGESPFYANYGIPAQRAVIQQVFPDYYVAATQAQFAGHFASLIVVKLENPQPTYKIDLTTNQGVKVQARIAS